MTTTELHIKTGHKLNAGDLARYLHAELSQAWAKYLDDEFQKAMDGRGGLPIGILNVDKGNNNMERTMSDIVELAISDGGLERDEAICEYHITQAWNCFSILEVQHPSDIVEFMAAIHTLQQIMAIRVARRDHPDFWPIYSPREG